MDLNEIAHSITAESGQYTGGPIQLFEKVGRNTFVTLLREGLLPDHKVLDLGAGSLRLGFWILRFLDSGCYFAMEPVKRTIQVGLKHLFTPEMLELKKPTFHFSDQCDMSHFGVQFDFVVARSIFTHMTPAMLRKSLKEFAASSAPGGKLLASYWPVASCTFDGPIGDDLPNDDWRFIKVVKYSLSYLSEMAAEHGLKVIEIRNEDETLSQQIWLQFTSAR